MTAPTLNRHIEIEYKEKIYGCDELAINGSILYRIHFPNSPLHLTKAIANGGEIYWTSIPHDEKLKHIVQELGAIITVQLNR